MMDAMIHFTIQKEKRDMGWVSTSFQVSDLCSNVANRDVTRMRVNGKKKDPKTNKGSFILSSKIL